MLQDRSRPKLRNLAFDLDVEIIDREAEAGIRQDREGGGKDDARGLGLRSFRIEDTETTLRTNVRRNCAPRVVACFGRGQSQAYELLNAAIVLQLANVALSKVCVDPATGIVTAGRHEPGFVCLELLKQGRRTERGSVGSAEPEPPIYGPVSAQLIGPVAGILVAKPVGSARGFDVPNYFRRT